jgi:hypothetical protein
MVQCQGTILKKCECASQATCGHKWTLRYWADGRQRELSFVTGADRGLWLAGHFVVLSSVSGTNA